MADRRDALAGAAQCISLLESMGRELDGEASQTVITVGQLEVHPNALNVIPGRVRFSIDFRSPSDQVLQRGEEAMRGQLLRAASQRGLDLEMVCTEMLPAVPLDPGMCRMLHEAAARLDFRLPEASSGALHDTAILAPFLPVRNALCRKQGRDQPQPGGVQPHRAYRACSPRARGSFHGMSGGPVALAELNDESLEGFLAVCGPLFEHSPWVAARTWPRRPFASLAALHRELVATVETAAEKEKIALIRAHPDLVGRLAAGAARSAASAREQSAAGLDALTREEADQFREYNEQYHDRFGFPFVICARENRKEAILRAFPRRLAQTREQEITTALSEIARIAWLRLQDAVMEA